jgi:hypothetical protein
MNKANGQHPSEGDLLLFLDGELESGVSDTVRRHLDSCWTCRMHAAGIQNAIVEFARERERTRPPEPPSPWRDLGADFRRIQDATRPSFMQRIRIGGMFRGGRVAMFCAAATAVAAVTWLSLPKRVTELEQQKAIASGHSVTPAPTSDALPKKSHSAELHRPELPTIPDRLDPDSNAITHEELAIVGQLHQLRADLGEPIDLKRTADHRIAFTASGLSPERTQEIRQALSGFPDLTIHLVVPHPVSGEGVSGSPVPTARRPMAFEAQLLQYAGNRQALEKLSDSLLDAGDQVTTYVHALENLHERFPATTVSAMSADDRAFLNQIELDHRSAARQAARTLYQLLQPIFEKLAVQPSRANDESLLQAALKMDRLLNAALAGAQSELSDRELYSQLRASLDRVLELLG